MIKGISQAGGVGGSLKLAMPALLGLSSGV
jgi:hypothetical protein